MHGFFCEYAAHDEVTGGKPRHQTAIQDQFRVTVDFVRADGKERLARVSPTEGSKGGVRVCRSCANVWSAGLRGGIDPDQLTLV